MQASTFRVRICTNFGPTELRLLSPPSTARSVSVYRKIHAAPAFPPLSRGQPSYTHPGRPESSHQICFIHDLGLLDFPRPYQTLYGFHNLQFGAIQPRHLTLVRAKPHLDRARLLTFEEELARGRYSHRAAERTLPVGLPNSLETLTIFHDFWTLGTKFLSPNLQSWEPVLLDGTKLNFCKRHDEKPWVWLNSDEGRENELTTTRSVWKR